MASLKFVAAAVLIATVIVFAVAYGILTYVWNPIGLTVGQTPVENPKTDTTKPTPGYLYSGPMQISDPWYAMGNTTRFTAAAILPTVYIYHNNAGNPGALFGSDTGATGTITGDLTPDDGAILWLATDPDTANCVVQVYQAQIGGTWISASSHVLKDTDNDGYLNDMWKLDFTALGPLTAGETQKAKTVNLYGYQVTVSAHASIISPLNATSISVSSVPTNYIAEAYISSTPDWGVGVGVSIAKIDLFAAGVSGGALYYGTGNNYTLIDNGTLQFQSISIQTFPNNWVTFSNSIVGWNPATNGTSIDIGNSAPNDPTGALDVYYDASVPATQVGRIRVTFKVINLPLNLRFFCAIRLTIINPQGTQTQLYGDVTFSTLTY